MDTKLRKRDFVVERMNTYKRNKIEVKDKREKPCREHSPAFPNAWCYEANNIVINLCYECGWWYDYDKELAERERNEKES